MAGFENLVGGSGADTLAGNASANTISAGAGNDTILGDAGDDTINGELGSDTVDYSSFAGGVTVALSLAGGSSPGTGTGPAGTGTRCLGRHGEPQRVESGNDSLRR